MMKKVLKSNIALATAIALGATFVVAGKSTGAVAVDNSDQSGIPVIAPAPGYGTSTDYGTGTRFSKSTICKYRMVHQLIMEQELQQE